MSEVRGFKVFNPDWICRDFRFKVGKTFEEDVKPECCDRGFHFCLKAADCFNYYSFNPDNKVAEVVALGEVDQQDDGSKCATNKIHIVREIPWQEVLELVNTGKACTGINNTGNRNTGNWNTGDWNTSSFNTGCFNTDKHPLLFFDKPSTLTFAEWRNSKAYYLLNEIDFNTTAWVWSSDMTKEEKAAHPEHETTGGYLKEYDGKMLCLDWWKGLSMDEKCCIQNIPNFDADRFYQITGIKVDES